MTNEAGGANMESRAKPESRDKAAALHVRLYCRRAGAAVSFGISPKRGVQGVLLSRASTRYASSVARHTELTLVRSRSCSFVPLWYP